MNIKKLLTSTLLSIVLLSSATSLPQTHVSAHANQNSAVTVIKSAHLSHRQAKRQHQAGIMKRVKNSLKHKHSKKDWFKDGLSKRELKARGWITRHESGDHWKVLSYGGVCVGYFQLNPHYLGYKHGHVNLSHKHQVKVADTYAKSRYGSWRHAKHFWQAHHWY